MFVIFPLPFVLVTLADHFFHFTWSSIEIITLNLWHHNYFHGNYLLSNREVLWGRQSRSDTISNFSLSREFQAVGEGTQEGQHRKTLHIRPTCNKSRNNDLQSSAANEHLIYCILQIIIKEPPWSNNSKPQQGKSIKMQVRGNCPSVLMSCTNQQQISWRQI